MFLLPENKFIRAWILATMIVMSVVYAWMTAQLLEPNHEITSDWITEVTVVKGTQEFEWNDFVRAEKSDSSHVLQKIRNLDAALTMLPKFNRPIGIGIDYNRPDRILITSTRLEIGSRLVLAEGILAKSVFKALLLQRGNDEITSSYLRLEVVTDVMVAVLFGNGDLSNGSTNLIYKKPGNWLASLSSYRSMCANDWRSLELAPLCGSTAAQSSARSELPNALGFRAFLGSVIWRTFALEPALDRARDFKAWIKALQVHTSSRREFGSPTRLTQWRKSLRNEVDVLAANTLRVPKELFEQTRLDQDQSPLFDLQLKTKRTPDIVFTQQMRRRAQVIAIESAGTVTILPGGARVVEADRADVVALRFVDETCVAPLIGDMLKASPLAKQWLFVKSCAPSERPVSYDALLDDGDIKKFALANEASEFTSFSPSAVRLAMRRGLVNPATRLSDFADGALSVVAGQELGLSSAQWRHDLGAYHVLGAVEAVDWMRGASKPPSHDQL